MLPVDGSVMLPVDGSVCCYQLYTEVYLIKTKVGSATSHWASEASPTLGCSIEISRDIYMSVCMYVCRMSNHVESRESNTRMLKVSIER